MKVAEERRYQDYRTDDALDVRSVKVALRRLRQLTRQGQQTELDLDETIDETCRNAGEIEMVFRAPRRNNVRLLLLMDVGGTMDPYYEPVSRLLTALHEDHGLREFQPYYFHNCIYDHVYSKARMMRADAVPTEMDPGSAARAVNLAAKLRCLVCQNQTIADSYADLAVDLRREIREQIKAGKSDSQILEFMTTRYGDFVLYRPPLKVTTVLLWFGPALLVIAGVFVLVRVMRARRRRADADRPLTDEERNRAAALLAGSAGDETQ